jgi:hypothetical protein
MVLLSLLFTAPVRAEALRVVMLRSADDESARRLRAELRAAGFEPIDVNVEPGDAASALDLGVRAHAVAVVRLESSGDVDVDIVDPAQGRTLDHETLPAGGRPTSALIVRAVEELRAKLVKLKLAAPDGSSADANGSPAPAASAAQPEPVKAAAPAAENAAKGPLTEKRESAGGAPPEEPGVQSTRSPARDASAAGKPSEAGRLRLWLQGGAGGATSPGGVGPGAVARAGVRIEPAGPFSVTAFALLPLSSPAVRGAEGSADVSVVVAGGTVDYALVRSSAFRLALGFGGGAALFSVSGRSDDPVWVGRARTVASGVVFANASTAFRLGPWLGLRLEVTGGTASPRPTIEFDGKDVASWGRPFAVLTVGAEIDVVSLGDGGPG